MDDSPLTRASLIVQLRTNSNDIAWQEFATLYGPVIYGFARRRGLQDADAADLMQDVMRSVSTSIGRLEYDPRQGSFRGWLFTITRNKIFSFLSARRIRPQGSGNSATNRLLDNQPAIEDGADIWEIEYQRQLVSKALERIKGDFQDRTWRAFSLTALDGMSAADASIQLGLTTGAIYVARSRVLAGLKSAVESMRLEEEG